MEFREYYASACPHCQELAPAWKDAASKYKGPVKFRQVECLDDSWQPVKENEGLCNDVDSFPTIKLVDSSGKAVANYEGARTSDSLVDFVNQHAKMGTQSVPLVAALLGPPPLQNSRQRRQASIGTHFL